MLDLPGNDRVAGLEILPLPHSRILDPENGIVAGLSKTRIFLLQSNTNVAKNMEIPYSKYSGLQL